MQPTDAVQKLMGEIRLARLELVKAGSQEADGATGWIQTKNWTCWQDSKEVRHRSLGFGNPIVLIPTGRKRVSSRQTRTHPRRTKI
jgi:hypothetical protein